MRAIVQRVSSASVTVDNEIISSIGRGLMVLIGIGRDDTPTDLETLTKQILLLKAFSDDESGAMWKKNIKDIDGDVLCVSQFTLFATTAKGKPDFHRAMATGPSRDLYGAFLKRMGELYNPEKIRDGRFGAMMDVRLTNEGPVTFTLDSRKFEYVDPLSGMVSPNSKKGTTPTASGTQTPRTQQERSENTKTVQPAAQAPES